jgi:hypothetical protein
MHMSMHFGYALVNVRLARATTRHPASGAADLQGLVAALIAASGMPAFFH